MNKMITKILLSVLLIASYSSDLFAQCASWNQTTNQIFNASGQQIGVADVAGDRRAEDSLGNPLSGTGVTCVIGTLDGKQYSSDNLTAEEEDDDDEIPNPCNGILNCNPNDPNNGGGGGGGGGGSGGGSGGSGGGPGSGSSSGDTIGALSVETPPTTIQAGGAVNEPGTYSMISTYGEISNAPSASANLARTKAGGGKSDVREIILAELKSSSILTKRGSGLMIDPRDLKKAPLQAGFGEGSDQNRPSLSKVYGYTTWDTLPEPVSVGVDDEVIKTSMAMYQPLHRMQLDYLNDRTARDRYLDQAKTLRGVLILAMGFLDKTLGTGLTDIQDQADNHTSQQILKQVNWSLERLASPDRSETFKDVDEKLEACLEVALDKANKAAKKSVTSKYRKRADFTCSAVCGPEPVPNQTEYRNKNFDDQSKHGNGSYAYCVCCAETAVDLNFLNEEKEGPLDGFAGQKLKGEKLEKSWSLLERAFLGVQRPKGTGGKVNELKAFLMLYTKLFGDYIIRKDPRLKEGDDDAVFSYQYQSPKISVQKFVAMYKNRCHDSGDLVPKADLGVAGVDCGLEEEKKFAVKYGICPSLMDILENWNNALKGTKINDLSQKLAEASSGMPLYGAIVEGLLSMVNNTAKQLRKGDERLKAASTIEAFCNASATAAVVRNITIYKNLTNDILMYNTAITQREKAILNQMIDKYFEAVRLADLDEQSKYRVYGVAQGIGMNKDRGLLAALASASQATSNMIANASNQHALSSLGSNGLTTGNGNGGGPLGGGGTRPTRVRSDFSSALSGKAAELMRESEEEAVRLDPLKNGVLGDYVKSIGKTLD